MMIIGMQAVERFAPNLLWSSTNTDDIKLRETNSEKSREIDSILKSHDEVDNNSFVKYYFQHMGSLKRLNQINTLKDYKHSNDI